jgi:hypothetical protein
LWPEIGGADTSSVVFSGCWSKTGSVQAQGGDYNGHLYPLAYGENAASRIFVICSF